MIPGKEVSQMKITKQTLIEFCNRNCNIIYVFKVTKIGYKYFYFKKLHEPKIYKLRIQGFDLFDLRKLMTWKTCKGKKIKY